MDEINIGDFVYYRGCSWIVINVDGEHCDLINGFQEQKWNVETAAVKIIVKSNQ